MHVLGHMAWSYIFCKSAGRSLNITVPMYLALLIGAIPDFDIYFFFAGSYHGTYTHSILTWFPVFITLLLIFRKRSIPYLIGISTHFLGDFLTNEIPFLLPILGTDFGLLLGNNDYYAPLLEIGALIVATFIAYSNGDLRSSMQMRTKNMLSFIPLFVLISLTLLFASEFNINIIQHGFKGLSLSLISISHIILALFLTLSAFCGLYVVLSNKSAIKIRKGLIA